MEPIPEDGNVAATPVEDAVSMIERGEAPAVEPPVRARPVERAATTAARHISRDYSYVRAEVRRIVLVAGFLIVSLVITALLRD
ncbi:MAG TPA: hypothetical protein VGR43_01505 [Dehalococcoidia bacterium]|nr:hypothetical protein [Dehalococcoidia bacterium]